MLRVSTASDSYAAAGALADLLARPLPDPMQAEWVAAPTVAMQRWLALQLATRLGASGSDSADGVAANIKFVLPGALRQIVLDTPSTADDPWSIGRLVWVILEVLSSEHEDEQLRPLTSLREGATLFARARRLADLFDRYDLHRPDLVRHWAAGHDVDALGVRLDGHLRWQPHLWRLVRSRIGTPSPAERMPESLVRVRENAVALDLPPRLAIVGLSTLPGGEPFLELVSAVASHRDVHLMMLDPSAIASKHVTLSTRTVDPTARPLRSDDHSENVVSNPLLRSWGRPYRERTILLCRHPEIPPAVALETSASRRGASGTLLAEIQRGLLDDLVPDRSHKLAETDDSVQIHSCCGESRQVDALRDAILHLLSRDPTLNEEDIVVLVPALEQFAPLIEACFGRSAERVESSPDSTTPRLRYRITDRSLRSAAPIIQALDSLLALLSSRASATEVLDFASLPPVRHRYRISDDDLDRFRRWIRESEVRWGFDGRHRSEWKLPEKLLTNSWRAAMDRLMMGVAVGDDGFSLAVDDIAPLGVDGADIDAAGRLADLVSRLGALAEASRANRTVHEWSAFFLGAVGALFSSSPEAQPQLDRLCRSLLEIDLEAQSGGMPSTQQLSFTEVRQLLAPRLEGTPGRSSFFRGGITISSLTPLRWLPYRVLCLLGVDEMALGAGTLDADDLAALIPIIGDRDPRAETRQALLEAVLAAGDHLIVTYNGRSVLTNQRIPDAVALAELKELISRSVDEQSRTQLDGHVLVTHPRQANDVRNFSPAKIVRSLPAWSFDREAEKGALARSDRRHEVPPFLAEPLDPLEGESGIALRDLRSFLYHPIEAFFKQRLRLPVAQGDEQLEDELLLALDARAESALGERLVRARMIGVSPEDWETYERARGSLPVAEFDRATLDRVRLTADELIGEASRLHVDFDETTRYAVDLRIGTVARIVGAIRGRCGDEAPGPAVITYRRASPSRRLVAWLDLMLLIAQDPVTPWRSVVVSRGASSSDPIETIELRGSGRGPDERRSRAVSALEVLLDCYRRGLREPLPLFSTLSEKLAAGTAKPEHWKRRGAAGDGAYGDAVDPSVVRVFGDLSFEQLCAIPATKNDPLGTAKGRAERYARYLYDAVASTVTADSRTPTA